MDTVLGFGADVLSWLCFVAGGFFSVAGGVGIVRLPDFFSRLHGGGITDTLGAGLILIGLAFQAGWSLALAKILMILVFLWITSPTACHALAQAALSEGLRPLLGGQEVTGAEGTAAEGTAAEGTAAEGTAAEGTAAEGTAAEGTAAVERPGEGTE
jgi:multicomponent Na+:H+ antiporter subunit G